MTLYIIECEVCGVIIGGVEDPEEPPTTGSSFLGLCPRCFGHRETPDPSTILLNLGITIARTSFALYVGRFAIWIDRIGTMIKNERTREVRWILWHSDIRYRGLSRREVAKLTIPIFKMGVHLHSENGVHLLVYTAYDARRIGPAPGP